MGLLDFLKGGKSSKRSKGSSRKTKASSSSSGKPTRAEKSAANKKAWAEKQVGEKKGRLSSKSSRASQSSKSQESASSASERRTTRAERSAANKKAWAEKSATKSGSTKGTSRKEAQVTTAKLTKAENSAANKKARAEKSSHEKTNRTSVGTRRVETRESPPDSPRRNQHHPKSASTSPSPAARRLTRAERSVINKEKHRRQRELEAKAARTESGSRRRRDVFETRAQYEKYLQSEEWKKKRKQIEARSGRRCERCGKGGSQVHHIRYSPPGQEHSSHLIYVCNACHRAIHGTKR